MIAILKIGSESVISLSKTKYKCWSRSIAKSKLGHWSWSMSRVGQRQGSNPGASISHT